MAEATGLDVTALYKRRARLEGLGHELPTISLNPGYQRPMWTIPQALGVDLSGGVVMVFGDPHFWPRDRVPETPIQTAFRDLAWRIKPSLIICNGDLIDATRISRHPRLRGQNAPRVVEEITAAAEYLDSLPSECRRILTRSNHDDRVDTYLANQVPEMDDFAGGLLDRLPHGWETAYRVTINDHTEVCHNWHGGIHAGWNNAVKSGRSFVTGHTHQLGVRRVVDLNGTRYGVECGVLCDPLSPQFEYVGAAPTRWEPGFVVLTFSDTGALLPPELATVEAGVPTFRGAPILKPRIRVRAAT
jgi:hypothetical protein